MAIKSIGASTAAPVVQDFVSLGIVKSTATSQYITASGINQSFRNLRVVFRSLRGSTTSWSQGYFFVNGSYFSMTSIGQYFYYNNSTGNYSVPNDNSTYHYVTPNVYNIAPSNHTANFESIVVYDIYGYSSTTRPKNIFWSASQPDYSYSNRITHVNGSILYAAQTPITSIGMYHANSLKTGTIIEVFGYGLGGENA